MEQNIVRGNIQGSWLLGVALSPVGIVLNTTAEQTFTVNGLLVGDFVNVTKPTTQAGLGIVNARVSAANTLAITFANTTGSTITPTAAEVYLIAVDRPTSTPLPTNIQ